MVIKHIEQASKTKKGEFDVIEEMLIVDKISNKHMNSATTIIDILNFTLIKNRKNAPPTEIISHYVTRYSEDVQGALSDWAKQSQQNADAIASVINSLSSQDSDNTSETPNE